MRLEWEQYKERQKVGINCKGKVKRNLGYFYRNEKAVGISDSGYFICKGTVEYAAPGVLASDLIASVGDGGTDRISGANRVLLLGFQQDG